MVTIVTALRLIGCLIRPIIIPADIGYIFIFRGHNASAVTFIFHDGIASESLYIYKKVWNSLRYCQVALYFGETSNFFELQKGLFSNVSIKTPKYETSDATICQCTEGLVFYSSGQYVLVVSVFMFPFPNFWVLAKFHTICEEEKCKLDEIDEILIAF